MTTQAEQDLSIVHSLVTKMAAEDKPNVGRLDRMIDGLEESVKDARSAFDKYQRDPEKMAPQLENLRWAVIHTGTFQRGLVRALGIT